MRIAVAPELVAACRNGRHEFRMFGAEFANDKESRPHPKALQHVQVGTRELARPVVESERNASPYLPAHDFTRRSTLLPHDDRLRQNGLHETLYATASGHVTLASLGRQRKNVGRAGHDP